MNFNKMATGQLNLLLIESNRNACYSRLSQYPGDITLTVANNENEALIALLYTRFRLILLDSDLVSPEIVNFVKGAGGLNCKTPIVVMVAPQDSHLIEDFKATGVDDCCAKPLSFGVLEQFIKQQQNSVSFTPNDYIQILLDKTQNNKNLALTIFKKLFAELPQQLMDIKNALQTHQYQSALDITHKLHGSVGFCGFTDIQQHAYNLENSLSHKDYQDITGRYKALKSSVVNFIAKESVILDDIMR